MGTALETLWEQTGNMVPTFQSQKNKSHTPSPPLKQQNGQKLVLKAGRPGAGEVGF